MILFIQNRLLHYRYEFYDAMAKYDDIVVAHSGTPLADSSRQFDEVVLEGRRFGPFFFQPKLNATIDSLRPTSIVAMFDVRWLSSIAAMYRWDRRSNWVWWGLDEGKSRSALQFKLFLAHRGNPIVFYNSAIRDRFLRHGLPSNITFVANNTFHVPDRLPSYSNKTKNKFINVGSLDSRKQNDVTIRAFKKVLRTTNLDLQLVLIGDGAERDRLQQQITAECLEKQVLLTGAIKDPKVLARYYAEAIASVSFGQAGLAVLQSMAFGVPFVTKKHAISGGEIHNISHGETGLFCDDSQDSLESCLVRLVSDLPFARKLGENAFYYYSTECDVESMAGGFIEAINARSSVDE